ncbi:MFS transporter [Candidatus Woesearchaeota archaeon]|nr:MFS transporter [Candidatus Woesearchaeota archaeon]
MKLFLISNSFFVLAMGMLGPIYAIFVKQIGGDVMDAGISWSAFTITSGLGMLFIGKIQDTLKKEKMMITLGYSLQSLAFLGYYFVSNMAQLYIMQIILGISIMVQLPVFNSFYTKYLEDGKFASQWAAWGGINFIITGIAALVGGFLVKIFSFKTLFLVMFLTSLIGLLLSMQLKEKK